MTIKNLYPKARPHIIYNVINGRPELPAQASFSRASIGTYVDRAGIIRTAAVDEPRFNYDPETGEFLGLMLEEERENLKTNSNDFSLEWAQFSSSILSTNNPDPFGGLTATRIDLPVGGARLQINNTSARGISTFSVWMRLVSGNDQVRLLLQTSSGGSTGDTVTVTSEWQRFSTTQNVSSSGGIQIRNPISTPVVIEVYGSQLEEGPTPSSLIPTSGSTVTREADAFSLTTSSDFDNGFSLLLDSNTTTDDFIYKIKAGGSTIAELNNDNGTLDWVIDGTSAATSVPPQYPQIGAIQPGRVRTVSSFGAAGDGDQTNYLYTESLSFPTVAEPAAGADELEFGPGQTVKAVYVWDGQLSNTEAVSVIKGEYNIILDEPIQADTYSFVYNTDPTNVGEASITLPYIVPTVSMRVYWGDTTSDRYEPGVTPSHTYPYPGQYRIQIEADDGFDGARLGDVTATITRVVQWAPQHRVGAAGDGFTGSDLIDMLNNQYYCTFVPPFKYSDLTNIASIFNGCGRLAPNGWDFVPTQLQSCTNMSAAFNYLSGVVGTSAERAVFPQLVTSGALTNINNLFTNTRLSGFVTSSGAPTNRPLTDTSNVISFTGAFSNCDLTDIDLDISSATGLSSTFYGNNFVTMPNLGFGNITNLYQTWYNCSSLTGFSSLPDFSSVTNFQSTWYGCSSLTSFPQIDTSSGTIFTYAWQNCSALTSFPQIDTSSGINFSETWRGCSALTSFPLIDTSSTTSLTYTWSECTNLASFPLIDTSNATVLEGSWRFCSSLTSFPLIDTSKVTNLGGAWWGCSLTSVPLIDTSSCTSFGYTWNGNDFTTFPALDFSSGTSFRNFLNGCNSLADFPANMFDTTGTLSSNAFDYGFRNCALTAQSIENILVSLDTNGASNIELSIDAGTNAGQSTWTAAANTAYTNLINKGWTITFNP